MKVMSFDRTSESPDETRQLVREGYTRMAERVTDLLASLTTLHVFARKGTGGVAVLA